MLTVQWSSIVNVVELNVHGIPHSKSNTHMIV